MSDQVFLLSPEYIQTPLTYINLILKASETLSVTVARIYSLNNFYQVTDYVANNLPNWVTYTDPVPKTLSTYTVKPKSAQGFVAVIFYHEATDKINEMILYELISKTENIDKNKAEELLKYTNIPLKYSVEDKDILRVEDVYFINVKFDSTLEYVYQGQTDKKKIPSFRTGKEFYTIGDDVASGDLFVFDSKSNEYKRFWNPYSESTIYRWLYDSKQSSFLEKGYFEIFAIPSASIEKSNLVFIPINENEQTKSILDVKDLQGDILNKKIRFEGNEFKLADLKDKIVNSKYPEQFIALLSPTLGPNFPTDQFTFVTPENVKGLQFQLGDGKVVTFEKEFSLSSNTNTFFGKYGIIARTITDVFRFGFTIFPKIEEEIEIEIDIPKPNKDKEILDLYEKQSGLNEFLDQLFQEIRRTNQKELKVIEQLKEAISSKQTEPITVIIEEKPKRSMNVKAQTKLLPSFLVEKISFA